MCYSSTVSVCISVITNKCHNDSARAMPKVTFLYALERHKNVRPPPPAPPPNRPLRSPPAFFNISSGFKAALCLPASKSTSLFHGLYSHPVPSPSSFPAPPPPPPPPSALRFFAALRSAFAFALPAALAASCFS
eukprot:31229-Pelagococcus_subviridis.AAC.15